MTPSSSRSAIQTNLATAQTRWDADTSAVRDAINRTRSAAHDAMAEMTALLDRLRRDPVEDLGLVEALRTQGEALGYQSGAEVTTALNPIPAPHRLPPGALNTVFRIAQEAFANIARHARAGHVEIQAGMGPDQRIFRLKIKDDGQGFDPATAIAGMGLANIRDRAEEIGGWANITSAVGQGCTLELHVPLMDPQRVRLARHSAGLLVSLIIVIPTFSWHPFLGRHVPI